MEHEIHSVYSLFWRNAYVAALQAGHPDPAAAADEAFVAFDCRFSEPTIDGAALVGAQMAQHVPQFGSNACDALNNGAAGYAASVNRDYSIADLVQQEKLDFLAGQGPSSIEVDPTAIDELFARLTADELMLQTSEIETVTPSVVVSDPPVQNPPTEGLPVYEWKPDDEVLG